MRPASLAVDIGGTKIAYGIVPDDAPGRAGHWTSWPSPSNGPWTPRAWTSCATGRSPTTVTPCPAGPGRVPVACHNDVRVWAFGEHRLGTGQGTSGRVYYLSLGTGVGGAIVDTHGLLPGPTGSAGESANLVCADLDGRAVRCEDAVSGPGLARYYNERAGADLTLPEIIGRHDAAAVIDGNLSGFGYAVGALVTLLDLSAVVLGGGVGSLGEIIREPFARGLRAGTLAIQADVPVLTTTLGPAAPLIAAAEYARAEGA